ncbi:ArsR/SmtB family transcription factor [Maricaulis maris]|uniref:ArsR family transcriptional regulator n=1 Tax=Maricaulis maris TaxID=74318 RepID=A0A495DJX0_9PROT|nr:metalloregulator ArsR/SmtB family transcription factor [Maricaulis maris]RKR02910.1 ArsR family transcriptional regulator [Maricaulis maris]
MTDSDPLDAVFGALAHPVRRQILARLAEQDATVNELAEPFDMSLPAISKHLRVLEAAGIISRGKRAQFRPCHLEPEPLEAVAGWADQYRHIWQARFDAMTRAIETMKGKADD